jgi:hypothetical protein
VVLITGLILGLSAAALAQDVRPAVMRLDTKEKVLNAVEEWSKATGKVVASPSSVFQADFSSAAALHAGLDKWPIIKLDVEPVPPRDYVVSINGQTVETTERSEYAVAPGTFVVMLVTRAKYAPCAWSGRVDRNQQVTCHLP